MDEKATPINTQLPPIQSALVNIDMAKSDCSSAIIAWEKKNWFEAALWINQAIAQLEVARIRIERHQHTTTKPE